MTEKIKEYSFSSRRSSSSNSKEEDFVNLLYEENEDSDSDGEPVMFLNHIYCRTRRLDSVGKYRIGPTMITESKLSDLKENKAGRLSLVFDTNERIMNKSKSALLIYLLSFTEQPDKTEIDLTFFKSLLDLGIDINATDEHGQTALHAIVRDWHSDVAYFAIRNKANVNAQDKFGRTPLHLASAVDNPEVARMLILHGADPNIETLREGQTAVHYAAKYNSIGVLKEVLKGEGSVQAKDSKGRTALFVAAEKGCKDVVEFFLLLGVPLAVHDEFGNSALALVIEKIPSIALQALDQFFELTRINNNVGMYVGCLEKSPAVPNDELDLALTPLEIIAMYNDEKVIMHPVVQKAIKVKWRLFGRKYAMHDVLLSLIHILFWMILSYEVRDEQYFQNFNYAKERLPIYGWKIAIEILIVIFTTYFLTNEILLLKNIKNRHENWIEWRVRQIQSHFVNCHPRWPNERALVISESDNLKNTPNLARPYWLVYEWINFVLFSTVVILRIVIVSTKNDMGALLAHDILITLNLGSAFVRFIKASLRFRYIVIFFKLISYSVEPFLQIAFLFCQFYVPFVAIFWLMFSKISDDIAINSNSTIAMLRKKIKLEEVLFLSFIDAFKPIEEPDLKIIDKDIYHILYSLFFVFLGFIIMYLITALITARFTTYINHCIGASSLSMARFLIQTEKKLNIKQKKALEMYYQKKCNPLRGCKRHPMKASEPDTKRKLLSLQLQVESIDKILTKHDSYLKKDLSNGKGDVHLESTAIYQNIVRVCRKTNRRLDRLQLKLEKEFIFLYKQNLHIPKSISQYVSMFGGDEKKPVKDNNGLSPEYS